MAGFDATNEGLQNMILRDQFFGRPFVKRFALCRGVARNSFWVGIIFYCTMLQSYILAAWRHRLQLVHKIILRDWFWEGIYIPIYPPSLYAPGPMLSDSCLSVLSCLVLSSCLSVTLVYCGQTVGWIQMKLGVQVGLGPGHIVLDGGPTLLPKGAESPYFRPISVVTKWLLGLRWHLLWRQASAQATLC